MIHPKIPQRYLEVIVFCLILTLAALGSVFLIYLFNAADRSPLILASSSTIEFSVAKTPNYLYNDDSKYEGLLGNQQQQQHHVQQLTQETQQLLQKIDTNSRETHFMSDDEDGNNLEVDDEEPTTNLQQQKFLLGSRSRKNGQKKRLERKKNFANLPSTAAETTQLQHSQQKPAHVDSPDSIYPESDDDEDVFDVEDMKNPSNGSDLDTSLEQNKNGQQRERNKAKTTGNTDIVDTIYIDDNEHLMSNSRQQHVTKQTDKDNGDKNVVDNRSVKVSSSKSISGSDSYLYNALRGHRKNAPITTTITTIASSSIAYNNKKRMSKRKQQRQQEKAFKQLDSKMRNKQLEQLTRKLQQQNSTRQFESDSGSKSIKNGKHLLQQKQHRQLLEYSTQQIKKQANYKNFADSYNIAYDDVVNTHKTKKQHDIDEIIAGSGSGDFINDDADNDIDNDDNDDSDDDYDIDEETTNFIKRINLKMWRTIGGNGGILSNNKTSQKPNSRQHAFNFKTLQRQQQDSAQSSSKSNSMKKQDNIMKQLYKQHQQHHQNQQHNGDETIDSYYRIGSEIVSNISAPQLYEEEDTLHLTGAAISATAATASSISAVTINSRINQISPSATTNNLRQSNNNNNKRLLLKFNTAKGSNAAAAAAEANKYVPQQQKPEKKVVVAAVDAAETLSTIGKSNNDGSEALQETRTRRILGNVKKSEERSRQLLLCEEAGGGELCRMLFKGHLHE